ncbi:hypothetical protein [uncultured Oscillibacter sp.]|uniref:hypothetical protein n=1 Tax=uncultured Oscillibacter sp. TaxID=876091 RepID=UPI0025EF9D4E|nr:hypothetical protein [uncultured Oscillibacter sp.]
MIENVGALANKRHGGCAEFSKENLILLPELSTNRMMAAGSFPQPSSFVYLQLLRSGAPCL